MRVWSLIEDFKAFNIKIVPIRHNIVADSLVVAASTFQPVEDSKLKKFTIQMLYTPAMSDNIETIQVFEDDRHIKNFMASKRVFTCQQIGEEQTKPDEDCQT